MVQVQTLKVVLQKTLTGMSEEMKAAQQYLLKAKQQKNFVSSLFEISFKEYQSGQLGIVQASLIQIKNFIIDTGKNLKELPEIQSLKQMITQSLTQMTHKTAANILQAILSLTLQQLFPDDWQQLVQCIINCFESAQNLKIRAGLIITHQIFQMYTHQVDEKRQVISKLVQLLFPSLIGVYNFAIDVVDENTQAQYFVHRILQIFYSIIQLRLPQIFLNSSQNFCFFTNWYSLLEKAVLCNIQNKYLVHPNNEQELEELESLDIWKVKEQVTRILYRLFQRYGNASSQSKSQIEFSQYFRKNYSEKILHIFTELMQSNNFLSSKTAENSIKFCALAYKFSDTTKTMQKMTLNILKNHTLPYVLLSMKDMRLFEEDQIEFVRKSRNLYERIFSIRGAAMDFILSSLSFNRPKNRVEFFDDFIVYLFDLLTQLTNKQQTQANFNPYEKEAVVYMLGGLFHYIIKIQKFRTSLVDGLNNTVLEDLKCPHAILRMRAIWIYTILMGENDQVPIKNPQIVEQIVNSFGSSIQSDPNLAVKVQAAIGLQNALNYSEAENIISNSLGDVLGIYIKLMNQIELDQIVGALQCLISHFSSQMMPYAIDLTQVLVNKFVSLIQQIKDQNAKNQDQDNEALSAGQTIAAIYRLLESCGGKDKQGLAQLWNIIQPALDATFEPSDIQTFPDGCKILCLFIQYNPNSNYQHLWKYFGVVIDQYIGLETSPHLGWANQYHRSVIKVVCMFIMADAQTFLKYDQLYQKIIIMASKMQQSKKDEGLSQLDMMGIFDIFNSLYEHTYGMEIEKIIEDILVFSIKQLQQCQSKEQKIKIFDTMNTGLWYSPRIVLKKMVEKSLLKQMLQTMCQFAQSDQLRDRKNSRIRQIAALTKVLTLPDLSEAPDVSIYIECIYLLNQELNNLIPQMMKALFTQILKYSQQQSEQSKNQNNQEGENKNNGQVEQKSLYQRLIDGEDVSDDESEEFSFDGSEGYLESDQMYKSPLLSCKIIQFAKSQLEKLNQSNAEYFNKLIMVLTPEQQSALNIIFQNAAK